MSLSILNVANDGELSTALGAAATGAAAFAGFGVCAGVGADGFGAGLTGSGLTGGGGAGALTIGAAGFGVLESMTTAAMPAPMIMRLTRIPMTTRTDES